MTYDAVRVEWVDSLIVDGQHAVADMLAEGPALLTTVGVRVHAGSGHLTVARDVLASGEVRGVIHIPGECIRSVTVLGEI